MTLNLGELLRMNLFNSPITSRLVAGEEKGVSLTKPDLKEMKYLFRVNDVLVMEIQVTEKGYSVKTCAINLEYDQDSLENSEVKTSERHELVTTFKDLSKLFTGSSIKRQFRSNRKSGYRPRTKYRIP